MRIATTKPLFTCPTGISRVYHATGSSCNYVLDCPYEQIVEIGTPHCPHCDIEMTMASQVICQEVHFRFASE